MSNITTINPADLSIIAHYEHFNEQEVFQLLLNADQQFQIWKGTDFGWRSHLMKKAAAVLRDRKDELAAVITLEMGKTLKSAVSEVEKCAWVCDYYAENAALFLAEEKIETDASKSFVAYRPLGVILAVMPWNYPFWQVFRFAAPALMAGNGGVLKHASNVPRCGELIQEVFEQAGFPKNLFINLLINNIQVDKVIENPIIKAITLTGSEKAGSAVAAAAGKNLKKSVLELGGSDAYIILEDADLDLAAAQCAESRLLNSGQSCIGAKRFIVVEKVYDQFLKKFKSKMEEAVLGSPTETGTTLAPMARIDLRDELHKQVELSLSRGAKLVLGGYKPEMSGAYYPATILTNVKPGMPAYQEELFGPVASVILAKDTEEAIRIANDSDFGLGSCVFTQNIALGENIALNELEAGSCFVNHFVKSDPRLPFGGIKRSGFGRELSSHGIREFVNIKTVYIA